MASRSYADKYQNGKGTDNKKKKNTNRERDNLSLPNRC